jgi:septum formation topological specificity factor MinE
MVVIGIFVPTAMRRLRVIMVNERFKSNRPVMAALRSEGVSGW